MKSIKINLIKGFLFGVLAVHLGIHALYLTPTNPATPIYSGWTQAYMGTFFTQNWHLFAPEPATSSLQLSYRCSPMTDWEHPLQDLLTSHKNFPLTAKGKQTYVLQHLAREIFNAKINQKADEDIRELPILRKYLLDRCGKYSQAEVMIERTFTQDYSKRFQPANGTTHSYKFRLQNEALAWN